MSTSPSHRYLDVLTIRPSHGKSSVVNKNSHSSLLIEPVLLPNLEHLNMDPLPEIQHNCLFYPNGDKNKNMRNEIEQSIKKHQASILEETLANEPIIKNKYRKFKTNKYKNVKSIEPLFYSKQSDENTKDLIKSIKSNESKLQGIIQVRV